MRKKPAPAIATQRCRALPGVALSPIRPFLFAIRGIVSLCVDILTINAPETIQGRSHFGVTKRFQEKQVLSHSHLLGNIHWIFLTFCCARDRMGARP